jgi:uncharacterized membrane protein YdbT with pleckstrin-like domain
MDTTTLWEARPSLRTLVPAMIFAGVCIWAGFAFANPVAQAFIDGTAMVIPWTAENVRIPYHAVQAAGFFPAIVVGFKALGYRMTRFALSSERLLYEHGVLLRSYDQIRLERIRDFRVLRPLAARLTGTGKVIVISRDETLPELIMGPFARPLEAEEAIRKEVIRRQEESGYRELETT